VTVTVDYFSKLITDGDHGGDQLKAAEAHEGLDGGLEPPGFQEGGHGVLDALDTLVGGVNALEVFFQDGPHRGVRQDQLLQVAHVSLAPVGLAVVAEAVAQEKAFEALTAAALTSTSG